jgi:N utilization substance protein B
MTDNVLRRARIAVLESLYESESSNHDPEVVYERQMERAEREDPELAADGPRGFGKGMLRGIWKQREELDRHIGEAAPKYPVSAMAVVDRNVLRLAIWELVSDNSAPVGAIVNDAVELANRYGGESSPRFVNGVLRTISKKLRGEDVPNGPPAEGATAISGDQEIS